MSDAYSASSDAPSPGKAMTVAQISLANLTRAWAMTVAFFALVTIPSIVQIMQAGPDEYFNDSYLLSSGNACFVVLLAAPIVVAVGHRDKLLHLHAAKTDLPAGALLLYVLLSAAVSAANLAFYYTVDRSWAQTFQVVNLAEVFGWVDNGPLVGFVQQFALLTVLALTVHTLASLHHAWVGWAADILVIVAFSASLVVQPLVDARRWLLDALVFHPHAPVQIGSCLVAVVLLYAVALAALRRQEL